MRLLGLTRIADFSARTHSHNQQRARFTGPRGREAKARHLGTPANARGEGG